MRSKSRRRIRSAQQYRNKKKGLQTEIAIEFAAEIEPLIAGCLTGQHDFATVETKARHLVLRLAARVIEQRLNADHSDFQGPTLPCSCGGAARYVERRWRIELTSLGDMRLHRAYYLCPQCHHGFFPRDRLLGITDSLLSPAVIRLLGIAAAGVSFEEASSLLAELADIKLDAKHIERAAERLGREIDLDEKTVIQPQVPTARTMYAGFDGTGVPMRTTEVAGRKGKQPDGSAKTREMKLATFWTAESRDEENKPVRDSGSVSYSAAVESASSPDTAADLSDFIKRAQREATRRGFVDAVQQVVIGDGAKWIWNMVTELFPQAIQIVDIFHAKEALHKLAMVLFGQGSKAGQAWRDERWQELDDGKMKALLAALSAQARKNKEAQKCRNYFKRNRNRMDYPTFKKTGLCISSGVVEAGCKDAIGARLKRSGMHWTVAGANAIAALRCCRKSGRYDEYWARRLDGLRKAA